MGVFFWVVRLAGRLYLCNNFKYMLTRENVIDQIKQMPEHFSIDVLMVHNSARPLDFGDFN